MTNLAFKIEYDLKMRLMRDAIKKDLNMSVILRRMVQLYLTDAETRRKVMNFDGWESEF